MQQALNSPKLSHAKETKAGSTTSQLLTTQENGKHGDKQKLPTFLLTSQCLVGVFI